MSLQQCSNAQQFAAAAHRRARQFTLWGVLLALAMSGCLVATFSPVLPLVAFGCAAFLVALWHQPKLGIFVLFGAALIIEVDGGHLPHSRIQGKFLPLFTAQAVPFFRPTHEFIKALQGLFLSPAELCMVLIPLICVVQAVYGRRFRFQRGAFFPTFAILFVWCLLATAYGILSGGDARLALLVELRGPTYTLVLYLLAYNLLTRRSDLDLLGWLILIGAGIRGAQGLFLYFVTFQGDVSWSATGCSLLEHYDSFLFNGFFFFTLLLCVTNGPKPQKRMALLLLPVVLLANILNHRRASTGAMVLALLVLLPVIYAALKEQRVVLLRWTVAGGVLGMLYVGVFWNSSSAIAQPIRAIRSHFSPNARDESSDQYRKAENQNLLYTIRTSPILGYGFGREFLRPYPMVDLTRSDRYLFLRPHNCIYWVWLRLGTLGFLFFWLVNLQWIARACRTACRYREGWIRHWSIFAVVMVVINLAIAYWDMGLYIARIQIYFGVILAVLDRLPLMASGASSVEEG